MIFSVSNDAFEWSLDFEPDSVTLTIKDLVHELTVAFPRNSSGSLELVVVSKTRLFEYSSSASSNYSQPGGTMEMRDEVLSSVDAQDKDTNGYQVFLLDDLECYWENDQLDVDAVFRPSIDTPFPLHLLTIFRWVQWLKTGF